MINLPFVILLSSLVGALALAFYMDWLGLWVSEEEIQAQIEKGKEREKGLKEQSMVKVP